MSMLNDGRNEIRFNNSDGKCLLENWVEERAVSDLDPANLNGDTTSGAKLLQNGHHGLLTREFDGTMKKITTVQDSYRPPPGPQVRLKGAKQEALERILYEQVSQQVHEEFNRPPSPPDYKSITHQDFTKEGFVSTPIAPTAHHDIVTEQPVTFWTEHREKVHGVSQTKTGPDRPFNKNTSFSKPIDEYWDEPMPYEQEQVPKM